MELDAWIAIATLVVAVTLFISKWIPLAVTALSIPVVLAATGALKPAQCLLGFGNQAVIALAGIFVLGAGLHEAGVATLVARGLERLGGRGPTRAVAVIMVAVAVLSAFMSNAATVAVFLPAVAVLSRRTGIPASRLMMPLSFAAILGGTLTLIGTTPNLILANELRLRSGAGLTMFEFARVGVPITAVGIAFMALFGWRMLPRRTKAERAGEALPEELAKNYDFTKNFFRLTASPTSAVVGRTIADVGVGRRFGLDVVFVLRSAPFGRRSHHPTPGFVLAAGDDVFVEGERDDAHRFAEDEGLAFADAGADELERILGRGLTLAEVTLAPRSEAIGKTLRELEFRRAFGLSVVSIWRHNKVITTDTGELPLELGDALLVTGPSDRVRNLARNPDFVVLGDGEVRSEDVGRAPVALLLLVAAILPPLFGWLPLAVSALGAAVLMFATGCLTVESARRSVDFTILFLLIGTIPLGIALDESGVAGTIAQAIKVLPDHLGEPGLLGGLFVIAALLSTTSNNGAAAVILAPVAAKAAVASNCDVASAFLAVAYGTSCAFLLPFAHQCNLMVMGPAGYATKDFFRAGAILSILMAVTAIVFL